MKFNEKLQGLRKDKGLSQEKLAEMLGVSRQAVSKWESGQAYPEMETLILISDIFGVTLDGLIKEGYLESDKANVASERFWTTYGSVYEYKSKKTLFGMPLVHVHIGRGAKKAKGIVAVGNIARGVVSVGLVSAGVVSVGLANVGVLGLGVLTAGLMAVGAVAVGGFAIGAIAVGIVTLGAISAGMFSAGALAVATHVAVGDHAYGHIAAGRVAEGVRTFIDASSKGRGLINVDPEQVRRAIYEEYPWVWRWVVNYMTAFLRA